MIPKFTGNTRDINMPQEHRRSEPTIAQLAYTNGFAQDLRSASWPGPQATPNVMPFRPGQPGSSGNAQNIDPQRIYAGLDVRTTIMLRNLPNSMTWRDVQELLDAVCEGRYDFIYVRIDFSRNTNVGYAFVNFTDPEQIIHFFREYMGREWPFKDAGYRGGKSRTAELSYAQIQGLDGLKEKFRNSSVMDEYPDYRPKLFYTIDTASGPEMVGHECPFPPPNNESKHQRSRANAATTGLYAPNSRRDRNGAGGYFRRSQYDRGTPAQIQDEAVQRLQRYGSFDMGYAPGFGGPMPMTAPTPFFPPMFFGNLGPFQNYGYPFANGTAMMGAHGASYGQFGPGSQFPGVYNNGFGGNPGAPVSYRRALTTGPTNGTVNGQANTYSDSHAGVPANEHGNGPPGAYANGRVNGYVNGYGSGPANGHMNGLFNGYTATGPSNGYGASGYPGNVSSNGYAKAPGNVRTSVNGPPSSQGIAPEDMLYQKMGQQDAVQKPNGTATNVPMDADTAAQIAAEEGQPGSMANYVAYCHKLRNANGGRSGNGNGHGHNFPPKF